MSNTLGGFRKDEVLFLHAVGGPAGNHQQPERVFEANIAGVVKRVEVFDIDPRLLELSKAELDALFVEWRENLP